MMVGLKCLFWAFLGRPWPLKGLPTRAPRADWAQNLHRGQRSSHKKSQPLPPSCLEFRREDVWAISAATQRWNFKEILITDRVMVFQSRGSEVQKFYFIFQPLQKNLGGIPNFKKRYLIFLSLLDQLPVFVKLTRLWTFLKHSTERSLFEVV